MIELIDLSKHYGSVKAVDRITLKVIKGEIFGFIGPNGAGKTTTIQMMGGLTAPTHGSVYIDGIHMADHPEKAKKKNRVNPRSALPLRQIDRHGISALYFRCV